jgi:AcrR family transcriptional regulator
MLIAIAREHRHATFPVNELDGGNVRYGTLRPICPKTSLMTRNKPDRRSVRTEHSLHVALQTLIHEKGYEATTTREIADRANVGRSTLYAHHSSKEGLLLHGLDYVRDALLAAQRDADVNPLGFSRVFFEHINEHRKTYLALVRSESGPAITGRLKRIVGEVVSRDLEQNGINGEVPRAALIQFIVGAFFSVLDWWLQQSPKLSPADVDRILRRLVLPALTRAE